MWNTCLELLHRKGCRVRVLLDAEDGGSDVYEAEIGEFNFTADTPVELLGLLTIFETVRPAAYKPYWWTLDGDGPSRQQLLDAALAAREERESELTAQRTDAPQGWAERVRDAIENSGGVADAASQLGVSAAFLRDCLSDPLLRER